VGIAKNHDGFDDEKDGDCENQCGKNHDKLWIVSCQAYDKVFVFEKCRRNIEKNKGGAIVQINVNGFFLRAIWSMKKTMKNFGGNPLTHEKNDQKGRRDQVMRQ
jgi:hypothetical protein